MHDFKWFTKLINLKIAAELCRSDIDEDERLLNNSKIIGAYVLLHPITNEFYVGSTENLYARKYKHIWHIKNGTHRNSKVNEAFKNNPTEKIYFFYWPTKTRDQAFDLEQKFLDASVTSPKSLNIAINAREAGKGLTVSDETKSKISAASKKAWENEEHRQLKSNITKKYLSNDDNKQRMINSLKIACNKPEYKAKQSANAINQWSSIEARNKKSEEVKKYFSDPINKEKYKQARKKLCIPLLIENVKFDSYADAAKFYKVSTTCIKYRIDNEKWKQWNLFKG